MGTLENWACLQAAWSGCHISNPVEQITAFLQSDCTAGLDWREKEKQHGAIRFLLFRKAGVWLIGVG